jgi:hypothetical protein
LLSKVNSASTTVGSVSVNDCGYQLAISRSYLYTLADVVDFASGQYAYYLARVPLALELAPVLDAIALPGTHEMPVYEQGVRFYIDDETQVAVITDDDYSSIYAVDLINGRQMYQVFNVATASPPFGPLPLDGLAPKGVLFTTTSWEQFGVLPVLQATNYFTGASLAAFPTAGYAPSANGPVGVTSTFPDSRVGPSLVETLNGYAGTFPPGTVPTGPTPAWFRNASALANFPNGQLPLPSEPTMPPVTAYPMPPLNVGDSDDDDAHVWMYIGIAACCCAVVSSAISGCIRLSRRRRSAGYADLDAQAVPVMGTVVSPGAAAEAEGVQQVLV